LYNVTGKYYKYNIKKISVKFATFYLIYLLYLIFLSKNFIKNNKIQIEGVEFA